MQKNWKEDCSTDGYSEGTNKISVSIQASNVLTECIGGREHLTFKINAKVIDEAIGKVYKNKCRDGGGEHTIIQF